jgi:hypothetical protein
MKVLRRRPSASLVVATLALIVAVSGTALAASQMNGDLLIRKGSLSGNRLREHTLVGTEINLNKLGKVLSAKHADAATNASALGGVPASGYLQTAHVLRGSVNANHQAPDGTRLFLDPSTGADVRHYGDGAVEITNTNAHDQLAIHGISEIDFSVTPNPETRDVLLTPGQTVNFPQQTIEPNYLDLMIIRLGGTPTQAVALHLTCGVGDNTQTGAIALTCIGVR